jgi:hypothetical protein
MKWSQTSTSFVIWVTGVSTGNFLLLSWPSTTQFSYLLTSHLHQYSSSKVFGWLWMISSIIFLWLILPCRSEQHTKTHGQVMKSMIQRRLQGITSTVDFYKTFCLPYHLKRLLSSFLWSIIPATSKLFHALSFYVSWDWANWSLTWTPQTISK